MGAMTTTTEKTKQSILTIVDGMLEKSSFVAKKGTPLHEFEKDIFAEVLKIGYHCIETVFLQSGRGDVGDNLRLSNGKSS